MKTRFTASLTLVLVSASGLPAHEEVEPEISGLENSMGSASLRAARRRL